MKKSFLTLAAIALVISFSSCKETTTEKTEEVEVQAMETEAETETEIPAEVIETPTEVVVDSISAEEPLVQ